MAAGQLSNPAGFVDIVASYRLGGSGVAWVIGSLLIGGELAGAAGLVSRHQSRRRRGSSLALAVTFVWAALGVQAFTRGLAVDNCGCFGVHAGQPLRWWVLIEDLGFVAFAWWVRARSVTSAAVVSSPENVFEWLRASQ